MPKIVIDGVEIEALDGQTILQAASVAGIQIPHLCYHPHLKIAGNCRMCLVEIEKVPKLQIACGTPIREGMVVTTKNDRVRRAREAVLEFLLINHPLDCPVCDQCGECMLQEYCFQYGKTKSRFSEEKHTFDKLDIGQKLERNQNRCIHCARCIRFMRDVAGSEEVSLSERSGHTVVGPYVNRPIEGPFTMNAADVCPVGALTTKQFRFKARSWLMQKTRTLCSGCARGCNVTAWGYKGEILRLTPEENLDVNITWMCDDGRCSIEKVGGPSRITEATVNGEAAGREAAMDAALAKLKAIRDDGNADRIAVVGGASLTNEDNFAIARLAAQLGTSKLFLLTPKSDERPFGPVDAPLPDWFIREEKTPNARGAADMIPNAADGSALVEQIASGEITGAVVFGADPVGAVAGAAEAFEKLDWLVVSDTYVTKTTKMASILLPERSPFEKSGTFTNEGGRLQKIAPAIDPIGESGSAWQVAVTWASGLGAKKIYASAAELLDGIAKTITEYAGVSLMTLPATGISIHAQKVDSEREDKKSEAANE
jgi:NADH-quinone oxidoreductase subunit G